MNHRDDWKALLRDVEPVVLEKVGDGEGGKNTAEVRIILGLNGLPDADDLAEAITDELSGFVSPKLVPLREWPGADCVMSRQRTIRVTQTPQTVLVELLARIR